MSKEDFYSLTPDQVLEATERLGVTASGEFLQLNSYENRVFEVVLEKSGELGLSRVICKFYRPMRWNRQAILEEHFFMQELKQAGVNTVPALNVPGGDTLMLHENMWVAFFPKIRGRLVQELNPEDFKSLGRSLASLHNVGARSAFHHRPTLSVQQMLEPAVEASLKFCVPELQNRYMDVADVIADYLESELPKFPKHRIHGDFHKGNLLQVDEPGKPREFLFVDFDDSVTGPAVQDFWMLLSGDNEEELENLVSGYQELRELPSKQLQLIPALRGFRILHYAGWIARRWEDPSFPRLFPRYLDYNYWAEETEALEKIARLL